MPKLSLNRTYTSTLLSLGTLLLPISPYFCLAIYALAGFTSAISYNYKSIKKERIRIGFYLLIISIWMILRTSERWGWGIQSITNPMLYPVTIVDYVPFFLFFFSLSLRPFSRLDIEKIAWSFIITALPMFFITFGEKYLGFQGKEFFYPYQYFAFIKVSFNGTPDRIGGGFLNPNVLGCYCVIILPIAISLFIKEVRELSVLYKTNTDKNNQKIFIHSLRMLYVVISTAFIVELLVWSQSRNALFSLLLIMISFIFYTKSKPLIFLTLISSISVYISSSNFGQLTTVFRSIIPSLIWQRLSSDQGDKIRFDIYQCAIQMTKEEPLIGWGIGSYGPECEYRLGVFVNHAHNIFLQLTSEIGLPFTIFIVCIMVYILLRSIINIFRIESADKGERDLLAGFVLSSCSVIILSFFALAISTSYRLEFLFWICMAIPYAAISNRKPFKTTLMSRDSG